MNRRDFLRSMALTAGATMAGCQSGSTPQAKPDPPINILFISADDMADWVGCLKGHPNAKTPNIDRLASRGLLFTNAHCVSPICGPSRAAILTGLSPMTSTIYTNKGTWINYLPQAVSLPRFLKDRGYNVYGAGKINHAAGCVVKTDWTEYGPGTGVVGGPFSNEQLLQDNMDPTLTVTLPGHPNRKYTLPMNSISTIDRPLNMWSTFDWGPVDIPDDEMPDGRVANYGIDVLKRKHDKPFFLGVGLYRPHQPFFVPRKYFDMHPLEGVKLPPHIDNDLADIPEAGKLLALGAWTSGKHKTVVKHDQWKQGVQGYLAACSFTDANVGKVLDALDASEYADNTMVIFWTDHGWHLGEKEHWGKHTPWQRATRVPLAIIPPKCWGLEKRGFKPGERSSLPASLLDLYPTVVAACGKTPGKQLEGLNLVPLLTNPDDASFAREVAVTHVGRGTVSLTDGRYRLIRWFDGSEEWYDRKTDPNEFRNRAGEKDPALCAAMDKLRAAIPVDKHFTQFVRCGGWKLVRCADGRNELYDMYAAAGISEQNNLGDFSDVEKQTIASSGQKEGVNFKRRQDILDALLGYLKANTIAARHVTIPPGVVPQTPKA